ncbi:hypothetical protein DMN91_008395 [Ooceraea biroi]|uniref:Uncharacterized protein n=1 Tax=Ooceraea biroi TaxID=2015173 RepID=A0A3L8DHN1_OOCBI|nr:hypothetical protein DMN91_008395 [Ooceraea biroi]
MFLLLPDDREILGLTSEQLQYVPKIILLERYGDYMEGLWDRLPEHLRRDPEVRWYRRSHRGGNCVPWFVGELGDLTRRVKAILASDLPMRDLTPEQREELRDAAALCHICDDQTKVGSWSLLKYCQSLRIISQKALTLQQLPSIF